jgi:Histone acetyltransferase subunit NuA4
MSNHAGGGSVSSKSLTHYSDDLKGLLEHQLQIKRWSAEVNSKIYSLEESYLEETPLGNIIRGWEIDGKPLPFKMKGQEEKERLFSFSSYQIWSDKKFNTDAVPDGVGEKRSHHAANGSNGKSADGPKMKKVRKSSSNKKGADQYEEWEQHGDY